MQNKPTNIQRYQIGSTCVDLFIEISNVEKKQALSILYVLYKWLQLRENITISVDKTRAFSWNKQSYHGYIGYCQMKFLQLTSLEICEPLKLYYWKKPL